MKKIKNDKKHIYEQIFKEYFFHQTSLLYAKELCNSKTF